MNDVEITTCGPFSIATGIGTTGRIVAWGKVGPMVTRCVMREPGDVWFNFGQTREEAAQLVVEELKQIFPDWCE